jgi:Ni/Fe-hydrogenase subunit HybB-like protein
LLFVVEFVLGVVLPLVIFSSKRMRTSIHGLYPMALLVMAGFCAHRNNMVITGFESRQGGIYLPTWQEVAITMMLISLGIAVFGFVAKHCQVFPADSGRVESSEEDSE